MPLLKQYKGTKVVGAKKMTRGAYNELRGWVCPENEDPEDVGYLTEDRNGSKNTDEYQGYVQWLPEAEFEKTYSAIESLLDFSDALLLAKSGKKIAREGWNGKGMFVFLVAGSTFKVNRKPLLGIYPEGKEIDYRSHLDMKTADGSIVPWVASQSDILAIDWRVVN